MANKMIKPAASTQQAPHKVIAPPKNTAPLHVHKPHPYKPRNANDVHAEMVAKRLSRGGITAFNERLAIYVSDKVGTMWCAYIFAALGTFTIFAIYGAFGPASALLAALGGAISSYWLQLVLLPVLGVSQNLASAHAEVRANEAYNATIKTSHDTDEMVTHLSKQDEEMLKQTYYIIQLLEANGIRVTEAEAKVEVEAEAEAEHSDVKATEATPAEATPAE